ENKPGKAGGLAENFKLLGDQVGSAFRKPDALCALLNVATDKAIDQAAGRVFDLLDNVSADLRTAIQRLTVATNELKGEAKTVVNEQFRHVDDVFATINTGLEELQRQVETGYQAALDFKARAEREIDAVIELAKQLTDQQSARARQEIEDLRRKLQALLRELE